eukprot:UN01284
MRVPLLIVKPRQKKGKVITSAVSLVDLLPTFYEMGKGDINNIGPTDGYSILNLGDSQKNIKRDILAEYFGEGSVGPRFMIKTEELKFIYSEEDGHELYNITVDPRNLKNLLHVNVKLITDKGRQIIDSFHKKVHKKWDVDKIKERVLESQSNRALTFSNIFYRGTKYMGFST